MVAVPQPSLAKVDAAFVNATIKLPHSEQHQQLSISPPERPPAKQGSASSQTASAAAVKLNPERRSALATTAGVVTASVKAAGSGGSSSGEASPRELVPEDDSPLEEAMTVRLLTEVLLWSSAAVVRTSPGFSRGRSCRRN
jgi:hypothetical protein